MLTLTCVFWCIYFVRFCLCNDKPMTGGFSKQNSSDPKFKEVASKALAKLDQGRQCRRYVEEVLEAETQVVAGISYRLKAQLCSNPECNDEKTVVCDVCTMSVWEKQWEHFLEITSIDCPRQVAWNVKMNKNNQ